MIDLTKNPMYRNRYDNNTPFITAASILVTEDCNLRCTYCVTGDTKIMMSDFTEKEIKDIVIGDEVLGFEEICNDVGCRTLYKSEVLQLHIRTANVIKLTLSNGNNIEITGNHEILSNVDWLRSDSYIIGQYITVLNKNTNSLDLCEIVEIEKLNEEKEVFNIGTTSRTYIANGIAVHNCFEKHKKNKMNKDVAIQTINFLFDEAVRERSVNKGNSPVNITFFGGEPTLAPDIIDIMLSCGLDKQKLYGIPFSANMITNATNLSDELYETFELFINESSKINGGSPSFSVQLSVDGDKETQDKYRITKSGHGSFHLVEKTVPKYKRLFKNYPGNLNIHGCLNKETVDSLYDNYVFFRERFGIDMIWFIPISEEDWDKSDVEKYSSNMWKIYEYIKNKISEIPKNAKNYKELVQKEVKYYAPIDRCLRPKGSKPGKPCGAGTNYATVSATGNLYPCHQIYYNDPNNETLMGNIWDRYDNDKRRLFLEYDQGDLSCPSDCTHGSCYRCIASNYMQRNNIFEQTRGNYCKLMKIDEEIQDTLRKELIEMGVLDNNGNGNRQCNNHSGNPACLCDVRGGNDGNNQCGNHTSDISNGCDVVGGGSGECRPSQEVSQSTSPPRQQLNQSSPCSDKKDNGCCCEDPKNKRSNSEEIDNQDLAKAFQFILMKLENIENMLNRNNLQ